MQDDILDVVGSEEVVGKSLSDEDNHKVTAVSLLGLEGAKDMVKSYDETIRKSLDKVSCDVTSLTKSIGYFIKAYILIYGISLKKGVYINNS